MSPTLNGSSVIQRFKGSDAIEIRGGITFDLHETTTHVFSYVSSLLSRFRNQDVVAKEVTRLIHSDPVSFIEIPDAAQVYGGIFVEPMKAHWFLWVGQ